MKKAGLICMLMAWTATYAQTTKKSLDLPAFTGIYVNSNYTVLLRQTNKQEVAVEALTDIYQLTEIRVEDGILMINVERKPDPQSRSIWAKIDDIKLNPIMKVMVSMTEISSLQVNGGGKIVSENSIASDSLALGVAGSGSITIDVKGKALTTAVSGTGNITLTGYAAGNDVHLSGSGNLNAFGCELERARVRLSGSGNVELSVSGELEAYVTGSGNIRHKGNTRKVTRKVYGTGTVERAY